MRVLLDDPLKIIIVTNIICFFSYFVRFSKCFLLCCTRLLTWLTENLKKCSILNILSLYVQFNNPILSFKEPILVRILSKYMKKFAAAAGYLTYLG